MQKKLPAIDIQNISVRFRTPDGPLTALEHISAQIEPRSFLTVVGPSGASLFTIELCEENLRHLGIRLPRRTTFDRGAGAMLWPGLRLYSAFKAQTAGAPPAARKRSGSTKTTRSASRSIPW